MSSPARFAAALGIVCLLDAAQPHLASAADCAALAQLHLPNTTISLAENVAAGAFKMPEGLPRGGSPSANFGNLPAFCRVAGTIKPTPDSDIRFEVWMPADWNGKFVGVGNGVWAGAIEYFQMVAPLSRGYATAATDDGHQGDPLDATFAVGHPEKLVDFGYRAPHEMTVAAKAAIAAFYGKPPNRSLFASCSTGGRQGLMEAYRFPRDYDGISSMAPANPMVPLMVGSLWTGYVTMKDQASRIPPPKFGVIHKAAVSACDGDDGVKDGVISSPERCTFDPAVLQCKGDDAPDCLTAAQLTALRGIYDGAKNPRTGAPIYPGFEVGAEAMFPVLTRGPEPFGVATSYMRGLVANDPKWDFKTFDYDRDAARAIAAHSAILDVPPTGLDQFFSGGRKLLLSHGWGDGLIPARSTVQFYSTLVNHLGKKTAEQGTRLFMVPGMGHCGGGDGPSVIDVIAAIDQWVGTGRAPERLIASNPPGAPARTRPLCPYPQEAAYSGTGSTDEEKNFKCVATAARVNFEGIWNSATATPLERPAALKDKPYFTRAEATEWEHDVALKNEETEPQPGARNTGTGTYNTFFREFGTRTVKTLRTSIITDPADGRIPALTPAAAEVKRRRVEGLRNPDGPEDTGLQDQCLAFATAGPPMLPYSYNSNYQIVQTNGAVVVYAEMIHDARIIHLDRTQHLPPAMRRWMGDSIGRWDASTLVVDTTNFNDAGGFYGDAGGNFGWDRNLHIVERFRLLDANTLLYQFDVDDPSAFTAPWKGELTMARSRERIFEYACHEGNYSLGNLLRGYRASERRQP